MEMNQKFRAFDKATKKMIATGFHVIGEVTMFQVVEQYLYENLMGKATMLERIGDVEIDMCLGITDVNGNDAYFNDKVRLTKSGWDGIYKIVADKYGCPYFEIPDNHFANGMFRKEVGEYCRTFGDNCFEIISNTHIE